MGQQRLPFQFGLQLIVLCTILFITLKSTSGRHECDRSCVKGTEPMICHYNFTIEKYEVLSKHCYDCPIIVEHCDRDECIAANGVRRQITVVNRKMPGESIVVCKDDRVIVDVHNLAGVETVTIHWHGQKQVGTPYMDGVPFVSQCPILPITKFRYNYTAANAGTFFYHSHFGFQRLEGLNGLLVVRQAKEDDPNQDLYDYDLTEHQIMITDWINITSEDMYNRLNFDETTYINYLTTILVNGKGRFQGFLNITTGITYYTPYHSFTVRQGSRYRFRIASNAGWICPIELSVDRHNLTVVGTDEDCVKPMTVDKLVVSPGERFDFIIEANQDIANYWMIFKGLLLCERGGAVGKAILKYENASDQEPREILGDDSTSGKLTLNPVNDPFTNENHISLSHLESFTPLNSQTKGRPDKKWYIPFDLYTNTDPSISDPVYYESNALKPQVNQTSFEYPPSPLMSQYNDIPKEKLCTDTNLPQNCSHEFCQCTYYLKAQLGDMVELIMIDVGQTGIGANHPWHLHGHSFRVIGESLLYANNTVEGVKGLDDAGLIKRNLDKPVLKDTVSVPHGGYTVLRFRATNPGFWAFHCHVEMHAEGGMFLVFQVGELDEFPKKPPRFPECGDYLE